MKRRYSLVFTFLCLILPHTFAAKQSSITPVDLRCEYQSNPLGIDIAVPRFSWTFISGARNQSQSAYELIVSDSEKDIKRLRSNIWNTGKTGSPQSIQIEYGGSPLKSFTRYYWRVRVYDRNGNASRWSDPAWFETAVLSADGWQAAWIGDGKPLPAKDEDFYKDSPAPVFRKIFELKKKIASARLYISGVGYYEACMNGNKIGDHVLDPGWTAYRNQVLYTTCDVTGQVRKGKNVLSVMLGNGWYNPLPLRMWGAWNLREELTVGSPCLKGELHITYSDSSREIIPTDETWQVASGPVLRNSVYTGEHYDARLEKDWDNPEEKIEGGKAVKVAGPAGILTAQVQPPVKLIKVVKPVSVSEPKPGVYLFDMGQNFAGVARIRVKGPAGTRVVLRYGEDKYKDGNINVMTSVAGQIKSGNGGPGAPAVAWQEDSYTLKGEGMETWAPRFTFHGFRYVEVTGWPGKPAINDIDGLCLSAGVATVGEFSSSNSMFNRLLENIRWTFRSNLFSVQSDCPAREKFGYGGDMFCTTNAFSFNYDMANFYRKIIQDNVNDQRPLGGITETTPYMGIADKGLGDGSGPLCFQVGFPYLMAHLYEFYGDKRVLEEYYAALDRQVRFIASHAKDSLVFVDLGDHESLDAKPEKLTASAFYYYHVKLIAEYAAVLGKTDDVAKYGALARAIRKAVVASMFDAATGIFDNATQSAQVFGLWFDFTDGKDREGAFDALVKAVENREGHLSTGIFATKMMFDVFRRDDRNDMAYSIANRRDFPGWGYMIENGATTLWETWAYSDNTYSQNHPMFGSISEWFYRSLLGINPAAPGFGKIIIKPQPAGDLTHAKGSYRSIRGLIGSEWRIDNGRFHLKVEIPVNTTAEIWIPSANGEITESEKPVGQYHNITKVKTEGKYTVLAVGSGKYSFETGY
ncbi:MAG: glycoside hydrolase family 78 protein [Bacteroidales bacterium]|jgi:alpha-L-rhamnosidase|nr:glycoside hydrolase family 78 protein [Bacteroidales bacterium]